MTEPDEKLLTRRTLLFKVRDQYNESSWQEFASYYGSYIFAVIKGMGVEYSEIEDLKQSVLLKLWKKLPEFDYDPGLGTFRSWLCTIIRNTVLDHFRANKKIIEPKDEKVIEAEIEKIAENEWMIYIANMAWENIKNDFSDSVVEIYMKLADGKTPIEISEEMGILRATIYVYKERVQKSLRKEVRRLVNELG